MSMPMAGPPPQSADALSVRSRAAFSLDARGGISLGADGGGFATLVRARSGQIGRLVRGGVGYAIDERGRLVRYPANLARFEHITGSPHLLLEAARTNLVAAPRDFADAAWSSTNVTLTAGQRDAIGGMGAALLDATVAGGSRRTSVGYTGNATKSVSINIRAGSSAIVEVGAFDATASAWRHLVRYTWTAGVPVSSTLDGSGVRLDPVPLTDGWWRVAFSAAGVVAANDNEVYVYPGGSAGGDSTLVDAVQAEDAALPSSFVVGARAADSLRFPFAMRPQALTVYARLVERGTATATSGGRIVQLGRSASAPHLLIDGVNGYRVYHDTGVQVVSTAPLTAPPFGSVVELRALLYPSGAVELFQSVDAAAETTTTPTGAPAGGIAPAWSEPELYVGSDDAAQIGVAAFESVKVLPGIRSLAECRSIR